MTATVRRALVGALIASLALASTAWPPATRPAHAAKRKTAPAAAHAVTAPGEDVAFDDITLELTADRLTAVLKGFVAANTATAGRAGLVATRQDLLARADAIRAQHGKELDAEAQQRATVQSCLGLAYRAAIGAHAGELRAHAQADAALQQDMTIRSMELSQAQANGDTTVARHIERELTAMIAPTHAESLAAGAKCGPLPPLSPPAAEWTALTQQAAAAEDAIRAMDALAGPAATAASGLDENQFTAARVRVATYLERARNKASQPGFSAEELSALGARRAALEAALPTP